MASAETIRVEVIYALPESQDLLALSLPVGSCALDAVQASGLLERYAELAVLPPLAIFGRLVTPATVLVEGDRLELLRPLRADPKQRRRERVREVRRRSR